MSNHYKLAVDVGGTFTDIALFDNDLKKLHVTKTPSSPDDPSEGVIVGIKKIMEKTNVNPEQIAYFVHGTTYATNMFLENKGSDVALLTTAGFEDVVEIGRQKRSKLYDLFQDKPSSLVRRKFRFGIDERIKSHGEVLSSLKEEDVIEAVKRIKENGIQSIAISYLHSYANPTHELKTKEIIQRIYPECHISLSHEISAEFREFERTITTIVNAYLKPKTKNYFNNLQRKLREINIKKPYIMKSNGGIMTLTEAGESVVQTLLSGPAGGVVASGFIAKEIGMKNIITFDMGGTSTDVALIENQMPQITHHSQLKGYPLRTPMIEMETVGAGGGSIGWIDEGGLLKVGPESAGAVPGPACYGKGGNKAAITDANLFLGRIDPHFFLGGEMELDVEATEKVIEELEYKTSFTSQEAALGMIKIATNHMAEAVRLVSVRKGHNPEEYVLFAFGGASPLHATSVARELGIAKVVIPKASSVLSAFGLLIADIRHDFSSTNIMLLDKENLPLVKSEFAVLKDKGIEQLNKEGVDISNHQYTLSLDLRFKGQAFEIKVEIDEKDLEAGKIDNILQKFYKEYEREYGYCDINHPVEVVNYRLTAIGLTSGVQLQKTNHGQTEPSEDAKKGKRQVYLFLTDEFEEVDAYYLEELLEGNRLKGPAIVDGLDTTIIIEKDEIAEIDGFGNMTITLREGQSNDIIGS